MIKNVLLALAALVLAWSGYFLINTGPIGSGYAAKYICSHVFISGADDKAVYEKEVKPNHPLFSMVSYSVDREQATVSAALFGFISERTAVYRRGLGCTLAVGAGPEQLRAMKVPAVVKGERTPADVQQPWPEGNGLYQPADGGTSTGYEKLSAVLQKYFQPVSIEGEQVDPLSRAIVVIHNNRLVAGAYSGGLGADSPLLGWSMTKTVTALLAGLLQKDGLIDIKKPAPVEEWQAAGDPRGKITLRDLLQMSSGLEFGEEYAPLSDAVEMLYNSRDMAAFAAAKPTAHKRGEVWYYSSGTTNIIASIIKKMTAKDGTNGSLFSQQKFIYERLFNRLGITTALIEPDASGNIVGSSYMFAGAADWARIGQFMLQQGRWNGEELVEPAFIKFMTTPAPASNGIYGGQTWLNAGRENSAAEENRRYHSLPANAYYLSGYSGQYVMVIPDKNVVVVRLGVTHDSRAFSIEALTRDVLDHLP